MRAQVPAQRFTGFNETNKESNALVTRRYKQLCRALDEFLRLKVFASVFQDLGLH